MKVVVIDDEKAMHLIMKRMLSKIEKTELVSSFENTKSAFSFLQNHEVDMVFVDISMPEESGLDFAKRLREMNAHLKLVFVTSHKEYALSAFDVYAYDYIVKPISQERLNLTIQRAILEQNASENKQGKGNNSDSEPIPDLIEPLTKRETEIVYLISEGMTNKQIAEFYNLSEGTVKNHIVNIFGKLQVKNRVQATLVAKTIGIIE